MRGGDPAALSPIIDFSSFACRGGDPPIDSEEVTLVFPHARCDPQLNAQYTNAVFPHRVVIPWK